MDWSKPLPPSLQNQFIPEEVLLSLTCAANAGPCPENLLPPKKIKTPKVCIYIYKGLGNITFWCPVHQLFIEPMLYVPDCLKTILKLIS